MSPRTARTYRRTCLAAVLVGSATLLTAAAIAADLDCAKLLVPEDIKSACGATVTVVYAQPAPTLGNGCTIMHKTVAGDSVRVDLANYPPATAKAMFDLRNATTEKDLKPIPGLGDKARQYHLTNVDVDKVDVLRGSRLLSIWSGKKQKAQVCSYEQMQRLAKTVLGRLPN